MKPVASILTLWIMSSGQVQSQGRIEPKAALILNLDYANFRNDTASGYLEIYYAFYPNLITLEKKNNEYVGGLQLVTRLRNAHTGEYVVNSRSHLTLPTRDTTSASFRSTFVSQAGHIVPLGNYSLEVIVQDSLAPSRKDSLSLPITVKFYADSLVSSDIELCSKIGATTTTDNPFYKNSLEVVPNPTLVFGVSSNPVVFAYSEIYNIDPEKTYLVTSQVIGSKGEVVKTASRTRKFGVRNAVEASTMNVTAIASGRYRFRVVVADENASPMTNTQKTFYIYNPHLTTASVPVPTIAEGELAELRGDELNEEFRQAQYLTTDAENKMFGQLQSDAGKRQFLGELWSAVGRGRAGRDPVIRTAYLQRVARANLRYRAMGREGWRTDRGRVFILYSEPDEIQRFPSSAENKPYEIWQYFNVENGVLFVFVDRNGFGDYSLVHSTKRGEMRDDDWQRYLR